MVTMKITALVFIILVACIVAAAQTPPGKLVENRSYDRGWEADMGALDLLSVALQQESMSTGYIFIYGARRGQRNEVAIRLKCMKNYMLKQRGIPGPRLKVIDGGYREEVMFELWVAPSGSDAPVPTPTIKPKSVRLKRGGSKYSCNL